ncbi:MAG: RHS repeat-associated core domain-containing protein [Planctomycetota bacterium]
MKLSETSPLGYSTVYAYDALDRLVSVTDAEGRVRRYIYDAAGRLVQVIDGNSQAEQTYDYTPNGRVAWIRDANNNTTTYTYDGYDRLVSTAYPNGSTDIFTLDAAGRVTALTTRNGQTIGYTLDNLDRLTAKTIPGGGTYTYVYDLANRIINATGPGGTIVHGYDTAGRLLNAAYPGGQTVGYEYDAASRQTKLTYPDGSYVTYAYDTLGRLAAVSYDPNGPGEDPAPAVVASYTYDALSRRTQLANGNGTVTGYTYSLDDDLININHQWLNDSAALAYAYDRTGLRTSDTIDDPRFTPLFNTLGTQTNVPNNLNQYTQAAGQALGYDANGNLIYDGTNNYTYDAAIRLMTATASQTSSYNYDPFDRRRVKTVDGATTTFIHDGDQVITEYDGSGALARKFIYGPGIDEPITMIAGDNQHYYHADALGSVVALSNSSGTVAETYRYSVYGEVRSVGVLGNPYSYTGRPFDTETGLYYYRARYYDAGLRRFLQPDPIGYMGGMNLYAYVGNSPVNWVDPLGLWTVQIGIGENIGAVFGLSKSYGIAISKNEVTGEYEAGLYATVGTGLELGSTITGTVDITISRNDSIENLKGWALMGGGSANVTMLGKPISLGVERNIPMNELSFEEIRNALDKQSELLLDEMVDCDHIKESFNFSAGLGPGTPIEAHLFISYTGILRIF